MLQSNLTKDYPEITRFLTNAISKNKLANSYIFIGKDSNISLEIARNLAKILNCKNNTKPFNTPCENCTNCNWLNKNEHPQALIIFNPDPNSKKGQIKIDEVRKLLGTLNNTSSFFRIIFFQSSSLTTLPRESCNLLLKTVEETPIGNTFIFATTSKNEILPTILSRSQTIYINKKYSSLYELINRNNIEINAADITNCSICDIQTNLDKAKKIQEYVEKNEINLKDYLTSLALTNYEHLKHTNPRQYYMLYKGLTNVYLRYKSFMQPKIIIEDLFLSLTPSS